MSTFEKIKQLAEQRGLSLREVSRRANLSPNALYRYRQGVEPKYQTLLAISKVLNVPMEKLSEQYQTEKAQQVDDLDLAKMIDEGKYMTFEGQEISPEDKELLKRLLRK